MLELDHLIIAARTVEEGAAWVEAQLGATTVPGGKHALMGTHNRLLALDEGRYLEVMAVDPAADPPARPRWFGLDAPAMQARLARGPALIHWVMRTGDIESALRDYPEPVEVIRFERGDYRWRMGVPRDGHLPCAGDCPTLIQWDSALHPAQQLPPSGCALVDLGRPLAARFLTPVGERAMPWTKGE